MIAKNTFKKVIGTALQSLGFVRDSQRWKLAGSDDVVLVVEPQKSNYHEMFYLDVYVRVLRLGEGDDWHVNCRVERLLDLDSDSLELFTIDSEKWPQEQHELLLKELVASKIAPKLKELLTVDGLRDAYRRGQLEECLVHRRLKELLSQ